MWHEKIPVKHALLLKFSAFCRLGRDFDLKGEKFLNISSSFLFPFVLAILAKQRKILPSVTDTKPQTKLLQKAGFT
jgi:hypothetical protein